MDQQSEILQLNAKVSALEKALGNLHRQAQEQQKTAETELRKSQAELRELRHDYEILRVQKGGFGFKMMMFASLGAFFTGLLLCYLFFRLREKPNEAFQDFAHTHQLQLERNIADGNFIGAEKLLKLEEEHPDNAIIKPQLQFSRKIIEAARKRCE